MDAEAALAYQRLLVEEKYDDSNSQLLKQKASLIRLQNNVAGFETNGILTKSSKGEQKPKEL
ncbi:UDP-glucuronate 4-epimerase 4-like protein [Corchorus olitorius]|uniref:UDP-glucuronate 4-epimerase 4-like protein n=1 Tax=Corchorus olitorius TaxID=93759 RepID=A0A1R3IVJ3_9ROSI|nr:UDP-glucuronate 4-epimerase 4-like protein [Corchorus olitorius]